ncbi:MAG: hypothetical protein J1E62_09795 [Lachnospiraceae bacterium]|nr:hypothetical protein [Lachnospiraceae bacterium]
MKEEKFFLLSMLSLCKQILLMCPGTLVKEGGSRWIPFEDSENLYDGDGLMERIDHRLAIDPEDVQKLEINGDMYTLDRVD